MSNSTSAIVIPTPTTPSSPASSTKPVTTPPTTATTPIAPSTSIPPPVTTPSPPPTSNSIPTPTQPTTSAAPPTVAIPSTSSGPPPSIVTVGGSTNSPVVVIQTITTSNSVFSQSSTSAATSSTENPNPNNTGSSFATSGLSGAGKTAVEVIVPIAATALIALAALWFWRRRKQNKAAQEARRKEMEEYGYNPNNDPTLPAVGAMAAGGPITHDIPYEVPEGDAGYRGWGATTVFGAGSTGRKPSTTVSGGAVGMAYSDSPSPHGPTSDARSGDTLVGSPNGRPLSTGEEAYGAVGAMGGLAVRNADVHRGPSNASSQYSAANISEVSGENAGHGGGYGIANYYSNDGNYGGGYGDEHYGSSPGRAEMPSQPVIRDNQARRAPRIENPSHYPTQGSSGIAQNF